MTSTISSGSTNLCPSHEAVGAAVVVVAAAGVGAVADEAVGGAIVPDGTTEIDRSSADVGVRRIARENTMATPTQTCRPAARENRFIEIPHCDRQYRPPISVHQPCIRNTRPVSVRSRAKAMLGRLDRRAGSSQRTIFASQYGLGRFGAGQIGLDGFGIAADTPLPRPKNDCRQIDDQNQCAEHDVVMVAHEFRESLWD